MKKFVQGIYRKIMNSLFLRFLMSYLFIFLVPFSAILITNFCAVSLVRTEINSSSTRILHQFFSVVDMKLAEMAEVTFGIANDLKVKSFAGRTEQEMQYPAYITYEIKNFLEPFWQDAYEDIFVYYRKQDYIIGRNGASESKIYYETFYRDKVKQEVWERALSSSRQKLKPHLVTLNDEPEDALLGIAMENSRGRVLQDESDFVIFVTLRQSTLKQLMASSDFNSELMIFDKEGKLLAASGEQQKEIDLQNYQEEQSLYYDTFHSEKYVMQVFSSNIVECKYVSAAPTSIFWNKLFTLRLISGVCILLTIVISMVTAWILAKKNYHPITAVLNRISKRTEHRQTSDENEIQFIDEVLQRTLDQISSLNMKLNTHMDIVRNNFLLRVLKGAYPAEHDESGENDFRQNHIFLLSDLFCVIQLQIEEFDEEIVGAPEAKDTQVVLKFILANVFEELCGRKHQGMLVSTEHFQYDCIINFDNKASETDYMADIYAVVKEGCRFLQTYYHIGCTVSVSQVHAGIHGIYICGQEAGEAMEYRYVYGINNVISYAGLKERTYNYNLEDVERAGDILLEYVKMGEKKESRKVLYRVISMGGLNERSSLEAVYSFRYSFLNLLSRLIHQLDAGQMENAGACHGALLKAETFEKFCCLSAGFLEDLWQFNRETGETFTICDQVKAYLDDNYMDANLNNGMLGDLFHISPPYLARMFKTQKGISLVEYLNNIRIQKIKELLETTQKNVEEIAADTGFLSSSTMIKTFKRYEGITPGAFRKLKLDSRIQKRKEG